MLGIAESVTIQFKFLVIIGILPVALTLTNHEIGSPVHSIPSMPISVTHARVNMLLGERNKTLPVFSG